jgi:recombination protein RecR
MYPPAIQRLIELFSRFPTVGPRTAARFVFYLQELSQKEIGELIEAIQDLKRKIHSCKFCFLPFQGDETLCTICSDPKRDRTLLCIVEKEIDLEALEKTKKYRGIYFVLGGTLGRLRKKDIEMLRTKELEARIINPAKFGLPNTTFQEIIIATNATREGETTALYLQRLLTSLKTRAEHVKPIKITRLGRGLPVGGELEYADEETLAGALDNRK